MKKTIAFIGFNEHAALIIDKVLQKGFPVLLSEKTLSDELEVFKGNMLMKYKTTPFEVVQCTKECAWESDLLVLNVDLEDLINLTVQIQSVVTGKVVITVQDLYYYEAVKNKFPLAKVVWLKEEEVYSEDLIAVQKVSEIIL